MQILFEGYLHANVLWNVGIRPSAITIGCVSPDLDVLVSQGRMSRGNSMQSVLQPIRRVRFTQSTQRQASISEKKGPSLGNIQVKNPRQRSPYAVKI